MTANRASVALLGLVALGTVFGSSDVLAQQESTGLDETRVIIPRAKIIRVPLANAQATASQALTQGDATISDADSTLELLEIEPIAGSSSGGGLIPIDDRVTLQTEGAVTQDGLIPGTPAQPDDTPRVRVISPGQSGESNADPQSEDDTGVQRAALTPEQERGPRWQRNRTRRFKQAPKGTEVIDTSRPTYAVPITPIRTRIKTGARLRQLDKMTGQTITFDLENGESRRVDRLQISLEACRSPKNNASHGAMAFIKVWDTRNIEGDPNFTGWMFAESPALSALDHPRYDLWVINCTTSEAEVSTVNE